MFKNNKYLPFIGLLALLSAFFAFNFLTPLRTKPSAFKIGITQIAPHPSLDAIRKGIEDTLSQNITNLDVTYENAQGNIGTATQIAQKFASLDLAAIITITTPSTQAALPAFTNATVPLIFSAVSDPAAAKLEPADHPTLPLTGVYDPLPATQQAELMANLLGKPHFTVGIVYNPGEVNAVSNKEAIGAALKAIGAQVQVVTATKTTDAASAAQSLIESVDALYIGNDNTLVAALDAVLKVAHQHRKPVFCADPESVKRGCLATIAYDQYTMGQQTALLALNVLQNPLDKIPLQAATTLITSINIDVARMLTINIPSIYNAQTARFIGKDYNS
jgi:putative ABC transport system substrate-binding protein